MAAGEAVINMLANKTVFNMASTEAVDPLVMLFVIPVIAVTAMFWFCFCFLTADKKKIQYLDV